MSDAGTGAAVPSPADLVLDAAVDRGSFRLELAARVPAGQVVAVLGPNGAGKTTLLRALAGLTSVTSGRIALGDDTWDDADAGTFVPAEKRPVGLVFQDYRLFPHLSVRENIAFSPRSRGADRAGSRAVADTWLERLGLTDLAARRPGQLSGGQAQRVALARALAGSPQLLLLDEPLAALDARTRAEVRGELRQHLRGFAGPALIVTHDPLEAMVMADRLLVVEDGRVAQDGTPSEVARRPATQYVARLVGLNLYEGSLDPGTRTVALDGGGTLVVTHADGLQGGRVLVGLQPSAVTIHAERPGISSSRNVWPAVVGGLELLTDRVRVQADGSPDALVDVTPAAVADLGLQVGQRIWLSAKATETEAYRGSAIAPTG